MALISIDEWFVLFPARASAAENDFRGTRSFREVLVSLSHSYFVFLACPAMVSALNKPSVLLRMIYCTQSAHNLISGCMRQRISGIQLRPRAAVTSVLRLHSSEQYPTELDVYLHSADYVDQQPEHALLNLPTVGHNLFIVHPRVKKGPCYRRTTTDELQLAEAVALTETLPGWKVPVKMLLNTENENRKLVFGRGNLDKIKDTVRSNADITALFFNVKMLTGVQHAALVEHFGLPIYDRYTMVLNIFREHAHTKEAKLQIALAEVPYYRSRIWYLHKASGQREGATGHTVRGSGETYYARCQRLLSERELNLRRRLEDLKSHRELLRHKRTKLELPVIAVVGYTNAGKTSLIKALTEDEGLIPRNQLFATLDVTVHAGRLPSTQTALFVDTVGFISNIPTTLVASFMSTLEDALLADVIVHVQDLSHPDRIAQRENVLETLHQIRVPSKLLDGMIEVGNKIDLLPAIPEVDYAMHPVSARKGTGIGELRSTIENQLVINTGRETVRFRVQTGGPQYMWLYKEGGLKACVVDSTDANYVNIDVVLTPVALARFKHCFGSSCIADT